MNRLGGNEGPHLFSLSFPNRRHAVSWLCDSTTTHYRVRFLNKKLVTLGRSGSFTEGQANLLRLLGLRIQLGLSMSARHEKGSHKYEHVEEVSEV